MPSRIIRDSIRTSDTLAQLTGDEERHFWRLVTQADDHGRFDARSYVIRAECYAPMLDQVNEEESERRTQRLSEVGLIDLYHAGDKRFGRFVTWSKHQRPPRSASKYPQPPADADTCEQLTTNVVNSEPLPPSAARSRSRSSSRELGSEGKEVGVVVGSIASDATAAATASHNPTKPEWFTVLSRLEGPDTHREELMLNWARGHPEKVLVETAYELALKWPEERNGRKSIWTTFQSWVNRAESSAAQPRASPPARARPYRQEPLSTDHNQYPERF